MRRTKRTLLLGLVLLAGASCSAKKQLSAEQYFNAASTEFREGAYQIAVERYRELLDQYPFSEYSEEAELKIGQAHFLNRSCPEAIASFTDFQRRHPTSPHLPLVGYLVGQCYESQMRPPDRDQSSSQNAHAYYLAVAQQYPDSPYADLAREQLEHCRESLAKHEMIVADFYRKRGNMRAAEYRLLDLVNRFTETDVAGNALYALGELYEEQGADDRAALAFASVSYHHSENEISRQAERALQDLGEEVPRGDPLAALKARTGRSRSLALSDVTQVEQQPPRTPSGFKPGIGTLPGSGPFGGQY